MLGAPKKKKKLLRIFLVPLIGVIAMQGVLLLSMLFASGVKETMEKNAVETDIQILENRQMALENTMINEWGSLAGEGDEYSAGLKKFMDRKSIDLKIFLHNRDYQQEFLAEIFPDMLADIQQRPVSGGFIILANGKSVDTAADYCGFFIRDSDPARKTASNADLLLERGDKNLARTSSIPLDNPWSRDFHLEGKGKRESDQFFYEPYLAGLSSTDTKMVNLGYWSTPFVLEDSYMDNHYMITYSMPLICDGTIYGVMGVEASLNCIEEYMDVSGLDNELKAGYVLVKKQQDGIYQSVTGKGMLYEYVSKSGDHFTLKQSPIKNLYQVQGVTVGKQKIYAMLSPMDLYSSNVPYENTNWELCALVTENSIFEAGQTLYQGIILMIAIGAAAGLVVTVLVVRGVLHPILRLMESVQGGVEGIRNFEPSHILEIDGLHDVVENVTEAQKKTEDSLLEEKERYRLALESSQDIFFTYRRPERCLEIVNTDGWDGIWDCSKEEKIFDALSISPLDKKRVMAIFKNAQNDVETEFRMRQHPEKEYEWYSLSASIIRDEKKNVSMIVGYLSNINAQKERELEEDKKKTTDPVTGFYRRNEGIRLISKDRNRKPEGVLFLMQMQNSRNITEQYGLIFGDLLLEQLSDILRNETDTKMPEEAVLVRAGASEIAGWLPEGREEAVSEILQRVALRFTEITHEELMKLQVVCGFAAGDASTGIQTVIHRAHVALEQAKRKQQSCVCFEQLSEEEQQIDSEEAFAEVISTGEVRQMGLVSIALNLFDRGGNIAVLLDLLVAKLQRKYPLTNLVITAYNKENMVNSLEYCRRKISQGDDMVSCSEQEVTDFLFAEREITTCSAGASMYQKPMFKKLIQEIQGVAVNMIDNGSYSGTIFFEGLPCTLLQDEAEKKELKELATVIQNRINQEKHDLSAQAKADFLARMSHEIRTPMNGIIGMTEIALKTGQTAEKRVDCLQKIRGSSQYLLSLVNDILDMSKIESGKMQIDESKVNLKKKLQGLRDLIIAKIDEKNMQYSEHIELQHGWFYADELRVTQVLVNILGNAIKYTNEDGHIRFEAIERKYNEEISEIYFSVKDDGIGISEEDKQRVFQSFEQARNQDGVYRQGTGLGLAISNRLVHMMGSSIQLDSELGKGSTFSFTLRLKWAEAEEVEETAEPESVNLKGKRILVAEDNELNREIIQTILEDYGVLVDLAEDGQAAVDKMKASAPGYYDMILMDIMMPHKNGLEATREIRNLTREDCRTIPIIAMTANAFAEEQKQSVASGMNAHLTKPLDIEKLQETLREYLEH